LPTSIRALNAKIQVWLQKVCWKKIMQQAEFKPATPSGALPVELWFSEECSSTPLPSTHFAEQTEAHMHS